MHPVSHFRAIPELRFFSIFCLKQALECPLTYPRGFIKDFSRECSGNLKNLSFYVICLCYFFSFDDLNYILGRNDLHLVLKQKKKKLR